MSKKLSARRGVATKGCCTLNLTGVGKIPLNSRFTNFVFGAANGIVPRKKKNSKMVPRCRLDLQIVGVGETEIQESSESVILFTPMSTVSFD